MSGENGINSPDPTNALRKRAMACEERGLLSGRTDADDQASSLRDAARSDSLTRLTSLGCSTTFRCRRLSSEVGYTADGMRQPGF